MEAKAGFAISLVAGIIILVIDILVYAVFEMAGLGFIFDLLLGLSSEILFGLGILWAILVFVGAGLIAGDKTTAGGVLAIVFSICSFFSLSFGGFFIGFILGIIGGALGIAKK